MVKAIASWKFPPLLEHSGLCLEMVQLPLLCHAFLTERISPKMTQLLGNSQNILSVFSLDRAGKKMILSSVL